MSTQTNPLVNQKVAQEITAAEVTYFLTDVLKQTSDQFHPGKLLINGNNGDVLQRWVRENNPPVVSVVRTLLESRSYVQAVKTLVSEYTVAVRTLMFDNPSKLQWEVIHPTITKRRALEAEQSGKTRPMTDDQGRAKITAATEKAKADAAFDKQEQKYEKDVSVLIDKIFFVSPRSQQRDERKIQDLQQELHDVVAKARRNGKSWGEIHAVVARRINAEYVTDEKARERWNSR